MENDTRLLKAIAYIDNALRCIESAPLTEYNLKTIKFYLRSAKGLVKNTKSDFRIHNIETELQLVKEMVLKQNDLQRKY